MCSMSNFIIYVYISHQTHKNITVNTQAIMGLLENLGMEIWTNGVGTAGVGGWV